MDGGASAREGRSFRKRGRVKERNNARSEVVGPPLMARTRPLEPILSVDRCIKKIYLKVGALAFVGIPNCARHRATDTALVPRCWEPNDAATLWELQIASDAMSLDA
jgi:hypothetical protein